jgi:hypothetical protein
MGRKNGAARKQVEISSGYFENKKFETKPDDQRVSFFRFPAEREKRRRYGKMKTFRI